MPAVYALVRVEDPSTGHQFTTTCVHAETSGLRVLDKPAGDNTGHPTAARPRTDLAGRPAPRNSALPRWRVDLTKKENA